MELGPSDLLLAEDLPWISKACTGWTTSSVRAQVRRLTRDRISLDETVGPCIDGQGVDDAITA